MYATIIASEVQNGTHFQVAVVARANGEVRLYSRTAGGRGRAGAWADDYFDYNTYPGITGAHLLGGPSTVKVTESDEKAIDEGKPTVLWQKLARVAAEETVPTSGNVRAVILQVIAEAKSNPRALAQYLGGSGLVAQQPQPVTVNGVQLSPEAGAQLHSLIGLADARDAQVSAEFDALRKLAETKPDATMADVLAALSGAQPQAPAPVVQVGGVRDIDAEIDAYLEEDGEDEAVADQWVKAQQIADSFKAQHGREATMEELILAMAPAAEQHVQEGLQMAADAFAADPDAKAKLEAYAALPGDPDADVAAAVFHSVEDFTASWTPEQPVEKVVVVDIDQPEPVVEETTQPEPPVNTFTGIHVNASSHVPTPSELSPLTIPDPAEIAHYSERTLAGGKTETEVFDFARTHQRAVAIGGHAGTGKTSSARHYAGKRGLPFVVFECNPQVDEEVVQGTFIPTGNGTELAWRYSQLATAIQRPSVILINESNRMSAKANALFLHILQERELIISRHKNEVLEVHPECLFITDYNPGYAGTTKHDQAFLDRFAVVLEYKYDREVEKNFIPSPSLLDMADELRKQAEIEDRYRDTPVSTRLLVNFVEQAKSLGMEFATASFVASFSAEERDALDMVIAVHSDTIANELGIGEEGEDLDADEPVDVAAAHTGSDLFGTRPTF